MAEESIWTLKSEKDIESEEYESKIKILTDEWKQLVTNDKISEEKLRHVLSEKLNLEVKIKEKYDSEIS